MDAGTAQTLFSSYRDGLLKPHTERVSVTTSSFDFQTSCALINRVPLRDRRFFYDSRRATLRGLAEARAGRLQEAAQHFRSSRGLLASRTWDRMAYLIAFSFLESAEAYLDARNQAHDLAFARLYSSMDADIELEEAFGIGFFQAHRIQSVHNVARLCWKLDRVDEGCAHCGSIIAFLEGRRPSLPIHSRWSLRRLFQCSTWLRRALISQVIEEAAFHIARVPTENNWKALIAAASLAEPSFFGSHVHQQTDLWLRAEHARVSGQDESYLQLLSQFLQYGRHEISTTWYLATSSFAAHCRRNSTSVAIYVRDAILRDSAKWPRVPPPISHFLQSEAA